MNELQIFHNDTFGEVRTTIRDGEPWFVAADVCKALEIDPTATRRLDDDEKAALRLTQTSSNGVTQDREYHDGHFPDAVKMIARRYRVRDNYVWSLVDDFGRKFARLRGLL